MPEVCIRLTCWNQYLTEYYCKHNQSCSGKHLEAVYTCDFAYESPNDSVYDFLQKVVYNLMLNRYFLKFFDELKRWVSGTEFTNISRIIKTLHSLSANHARNRAAIRAQNRTRVDNQPLTLSLEYVASRSWPVEPFMLPNDCVFE
jgi:hypothetical protein